MKCNLELLGLYSCKNGEVIEVNWDSCFKKYVLCFQKTSKVLLNEEYTTKLLKSYDAVKYC